MCKRKNTSLLACVKAKQVLIGISLLPNKIWIMENLIILPKLLLYLHNELIWVVQKHGVTLYRLACTWDVEIRKLAPSRGLQFCTPHDNKGHSIHTKGTTRHETRGNLVNECLNTWMGTVIILSHSYTLATTHGYKQ